MGLLQYIHLLKCFHPVLVFLVNSAVDAVLNVYLKKLLLQHLQVIISEVFHAL